jgi:hypothetical protein
MGIRSPDFLEMSESMGVTFWAVCLLNMDANFAMLVVFGLSKNGPEEQS